MLSLALASVLLALAVPAQAAFSGANGKIAFFSTTFGGIHAINPDGTSEVSLADGNNPAWSPDGQKIAFDKAGQAGNSDIYTMNADGTNQRQLTSDPARDDRPGWSPDGKKIVFTTYRGGITGYNAAIYTVNPDGSGETPLPTPAFGSEPAWAPDGTKIAFAHTGPDGRAEIYTMNPDGTAQIQITDDAGASTRQTNEEPNWSPDSQMIVLTHTVFYAGEEILTSSIQVMNADGSGRVYLTPNTQDSHDLSPAWSPDGQKIAFMGPITSMWTMNRDGSNQTQLTSGRVPDWQPINPAPYPRPVGASPMHISLVPAFVPCTPGSANASHPAPLAGSSCNPPLPRSSSVAVGPRSLGFTRRRVLAQGECAPFDTAHCYPDVTIHTSISDVRAGSPIGPDYDSSNPKGWDLTATAALPGEAQGTALRITDLDNQSAGDPSGPYDKAATVVALSFPIPLDCTPTSDSSLGSSCDVATTANTLVPGSAVAGKRAIWQIGQFQILDQGANGVPADSDDKVFETQGLVVP